MYRPTETTSIRVGKFLTDYGVYFPEHSIATRGGIGFDAGDETYNLEYGYQGENWSGSVTADLGRPEDASMMREKGAAATAGWNPNDHSKIGWSSYFGTLNSTSRELTGPYALLGFTPTFYVEGEVDLQFSQPAQGKANQGLFTYERVGYELIQGVQLYLMQQTFIRSFQGMNTLPFGMTNRLYGVGPGIYWFPRPHFFFQLEVQDQFSQELPSTQMSGFFTGNIYL